MFKVYKVSGLGTVDRLTRVFRGAGFQQQLSEVHAENVRKGNGADMQLTADQVRELKEAGLTVVQMT